MTVNIETLSGGTISTLSLATPLDPGLHDVTLRLFARMRSAMPWIPYDPSGLAVLAMSQNSYPYPDQTIVNPPPWVNTADRMNAWREMAGQFVPLTQAILAGQQAQAKAAGEVLDRNVAFWNDVAKYSGADAVQKVWDDLWAAVASFKAQRDATKVALDTAKGVLATYAARMPATYANRTALLDSQYASLSNRAAVALAPLGAAGKTAAGLGVAPLIIAGIAAGAITAIAASVWGIAHEFASVQLNANNNAQEILKTRDALDHADFAAGKITNEQLTQRRQENVKAATDLVHAEGAASIGSAFGKAAFGAALGVGALVAAGLGLWLLTRKKTS